MKALVCSALLFLAARGAFALPPSEVHRKAEPSVVMVEVERYPDEDAQGSGVVVGPERVITNCHVAKRATRIAVRRSDLRLPATVVQAAHAKDLCLLSVPGLKLRPVRMRPLSELSIGETVYAIGAPLGLESTFTQGIISRFRLEEHDSIQITAPIFFGSSGGGLFDEAGLLVGVTSGGVAVTQGFNFAVPVDWIIKALDDEREDAARGRLEKLEQRAATINVKEKQVRALEEDQARRHQELDEERQRLNERERQLALREIEQRRRLKEKEERESQIRGQEAARRAELEGQLAQLQATTANEQVEDSPRAEEKEEAAEAKDLATWKQRIHDHIKSKLVIPPGLPQRIKASYAITLLRGGWIIERKQQESSGYPAYDQAIERAIALAEPLPVPSDATALQRLRDLTLIFTPGRRDEVYQQPSAPASSLTAVVQEVPAPVTANPPQPPRHSPTPSPMPPRVEPQIQLRQQLQPAAPVSCPPVTALLPPPAPEQESLDEGDIASFGLSISKRLGRVVDQIGHDRVYPQLARESKWEGVTHISVEFSGGRVKRVWVAKTSGYPLLDQRAIDLVQEVLRNVTMPPPLRRRNQFTVTLPMVFKLQES